MKSHMWPCTYDSATLDAETERLAVQDHLEYIVRPLYPISKTQAYMGNNHAVNICKPSLLNRHHSRIC